MISEYLKTSYKKGGRGPLEYDCWGLVRTVRHEVFGKPLLPSFGSICPRDKRELTKACNAVRQEGDFQVVSKRVGAIATAWRASLCVHVGICVEVDARLWVLESEEVTGPALISPSLFEARYTKVIYFDDEPQDGGDSLLQG